MRVGLRTSHGIASCVRPINTASAMIAVVTSANSARRSRRSVRRSIDVYLAADRAGVRAQARLPSFPRKRQSMLLFVAPRKMDSRFRGNDGAEQDAHASAPDAHAFRRVEPASPHNAPASQQHDIVLLLRIVLLG